MHPVCQTSQSLVVSVSSKTRTGHHPASHHGICCGSDDSGQTGEQEETQRDLQPATKLSQVSQLSILTINNQIENVRV